jgi:hypothetical protein
LQGVAAVDGDNIKSVARVLFGSGFLGISEILSMLSFNAGVVAFIAMFVLAIGERVR